MAGANDRHRSVQVFGEHPDRQIVDGRRTARFARQPTFTFISSIRGSSIDFGIARRPLKRKVAGQRLVFRAARQAKLVRTGRQCQLHVSGSTTPVPAATVFLTF